MGTLPIIRPMPGTGFSGSRGMASKRIVPTDGPNNVFVPQTSEDWLALNLPAPDAQWNLQEASGALVRAIGTVNLSPTGTADQLYQQTVAGWNRKFVGLTQGSSGHFEYSGTTLDFGAGVSVAWLIYFAAGGSGGLVEWADAPWGVRIQVGTLLPYVYVNSVNAGGAVPVRGISTVQPMLSGRNCTASTVRMFTDDEQVNGVFTGITSGTGMDKGLGVNLVTAPASRYCLAACWLGANAETILSKATLVALGWPTAY